MNSAANYISDIMTNVVNLFKNIMDRAYLTKPTKNDLQTFIDNKQLANDAKTVIKKLIDSKTMTKELKNNVKEILDKYGNLAEKTKEMDNKLVKYNDDISVFIGSIEEVEKKLDMECERYCKFTKNNPAEHIKFYKTNKNYIYESNNKKFARKNQEEVIKIAKTKFKDTFATIGGNTNLIQKINYKDKTFLIYNHKNEFYFDINHIVNLFDDLKKKRAKYDKYKDKIELRHIKNNKFGGFYIKEMVREDIFYDMLLNTNSIFTKKFKSDIAQLLIKLRTNGFLAMNDDKIDIIDPKAIKKQQSENTKILSVYEPYRQKFDNHPFLSFANQIMIDFQKKITLNKYHGLHVMYMFILSLADPDGLNRIICKIGYSGNIIKRMTTLPREFGCNFFLIGIKTVYKESDEEDFHKLLKVRFPELIVKHRINKTDKTETYVFDEKIVNEFMSYADKVKFDDKQIALDDEARAIIKQYTDNVNPNYEKYIVERQFALRDDVKMSNTELAEYNLNTGKIYYDYSLHKANIEKDIIISNSNNEKEIIITKSNNEKEILIKEYEDKLKQKDVILKEHDIKLKEMELKIMERDIELQKIKNAALKIGLKYEPGEDEYKLISVGSHKGCR